MAEVDRNAGGHHSLIGRNLATRSDDVETPDGPRRRSWLLEVSVGGCRPRSSLGASRRDRVVCGHGRCLHQQHLACATAGSGL